LNLAVRTALADATVQGALINIGGEAAPSSGREYADLIRVETEKWAALARKLGIVQSQ
jgi:hypothetical protein